MVKLLLKLLYHNRLGLSLDLLDINLLNSINESENSETQKEGPPNSWPPPPYTSIRKNCASVDGFTTLVREIDRSIFLPAGNKFIFEQ